MMDVFFQLVLYMYYDYNDKNTVGKHLFFLIQSILLFHDRCCFTFERVVTCFDRFKRVWTDLNGLKRVSTGCNMFRRVSTGLDGCWRVSTGCTNMDTPRMFVDVTGLTPGGRRF